MAKRQTHVPKDEGTLSSNGAAKPTSGREWRQAREEGYVKTLISGHVVRLRPLDMATMLLAGDIPDFLSGIVHQMLSAGIDAPDYRKPMPPAPAAIALFGVTAELLPLVNLICRAAFLSPRIVEEPLADDEISIDDVELIDRALVFNLVTQGADALRRFHFQPPPDVADLPDRQDLRAEAEPTAADRERLGSLAV